MSQLNHRWPKKTAAALRLAVCTALLLFGVPGSATVAQAATVTGENLRAVTFVNSTTGFAVGTGATILKTTNQGLSWSVVKSGGTEDFTGVSFIDASNGWVVSRSGRVYRTSNGGMTWTLVSADIAELYSNEEFFDVEFVSELVGRACGWAPFDPPVAVPLVFMSNNAGNGSWGAKPELEAGEYDPPETRPPTPKDGYGRFYAMDFPSASYGYAVGIDEWVTPNKSVIWKYDSVAPNSADWKRQTVAGSVRLYDVSFDTTSAGMVVGGSGAVRRTTNGGSTWTTGTSGVSDDLLGVAIATGGANAWAVGRNGRIIRSVDGGSTWTTLISPTVFDLDGVASFGPTGAVAVGANGTIVRTDDGINWSRTGELPSMQYVTSTSHVEGEWSADWSVDALWGASPIGAIDGYSIVFDQQPATVPPMVVNTTASGATLNAGSSGLWYLHVRARDVYGQWSAPAHYEVRIDRTAPTASDNASAYYKTSPATVRISAADAGGSGLASIEYRLDGAATQTITGTSTVDVAVTGQGAHTIAYIAADGVGNRSALATATLAIDSVAPTVIVPSAVYYTGAPSQMSLSATDGGSGVASISYRVDSGTTITVAGAAATATISGEGSHTVLVSAADNAGNSSSAVSKAVFLDSVKPTVSDNVAASYPGSAVFRLAGSDSGSGVASISYRIDGGATMTVAGAATTVTVEGAGAHTVQYWATDVAGNSANAVSKGFDAGTDTTPPTLQDDIAQYYSSSPVTVTLSAVDPGSGVASLGYRLDGAATVTVGASAVSFSVSGESTHTVTYSAVDGLGHVAPAITRQFRIDTTAPTVSDDTLALYATPVASVRLSATDGGSGVVSIEYRLDGAPTQTVAAADATVTVSGDGEHSLVFAATDAAGNRSAAQNRTLRIDTVAPVASDDALAYYRTATATVNMSASDVGGSGVASLGYRLDGATTTSVNVLPTSVSVSNEGTHTLVYSAADVAGNRSTTVTRQFVIDRTAPQPTSDLQSYYATKNVPVALGAADAVSGVSSVALRVDSEPTVTVSASALSTTLPLGEGVHTVRYSATDRAGNVAEAVVHTLTVDTVAPSATDNAQESYASAPASIKISGDDYSGSGVATMRYRIGSSATVSSPGSQATVTLGANGSYSLEYWAVDKAGNSSTHKTRTIQVGPVVAQTLRIASDTRYSTAVSIARAAFDANAAAAGTQWTGIEHVVIASGEDRAAADPLAAAGLCGAYDAPLFLVSSADVPREVEAAVREIRQQNGTIQVHIVGGPMSVPDARFTELSKATNGGLVKDRVLSTGGRYDLAAEIAREMKRIRGSAPATVLIANGADQTKFFDALALSPIAARRGFPVLLVEANSVPKATSKVLAELRPSTVIVGGGPNTVSDSVVRGLGGTRWASATRYSTAIAIADNAIARGWLDARSVGIAAKLPDALTGGSAIGRRGGVLLLTDGAALTKETRSWLVAHSGTVGTSWVFGGTRSVTPTVYSAIVAALQ